MKRKLIQSLLCTLLLLPHIAYSTICDDPTASESVRIYYANGMSNEGVDMDLGVRKIRGMMGNSYDYGKSENMDEVAYDELIELNSSPEKEVLRLVDFRRTKTGFSPTSTGIKRKSCGAFGTFVPMNPEFINSAMGNKPAREVKRSFVVSSWYGSIFMSPGCFTHWAM